MLTGGLFSCHLEMVNLDSYDSEGPHTPETDDSAEVRSACLCVCGFNPINDCAPISDEASWCVFMRSLLL